MTSKSTAAGSLQITYTLTFPEAQAHYVEVEMNIDGIADTSIDLKMPVWTPGSYMLREFSKNVEAFTATHNGQLLAARKTSKNTWHIPLEGAQRVEVKYRVYCFEISVRTSFINAAHGFISGSGIFLYPAGRIDQPSTIHIIPYKGWTTVSTSLDAVNNDPFTLYAPNYDILFDSPVEIGTQDVFGFEAAGVKYEVAMCLGGNYDKARLTRDLQKMVEKETEIFDENPNKRYVFIVHNYLKNGGGLEHLSSTVLGASRDAYTNEDSYQHFLALAAHEHFHLWNVKRLRPAALGPFDYDQENYTTDLWIAEGFTNYFDNLIVQRMGLYPVDNYLNALAADINLIENQPGNKIQPLYEASFDAWIKYYRPNENSNNSGVSYYSKGAVVAMLLDLEIIHHSDGKYSLDDVMKEAYTEFYKNKKRGYTDTEFKQLLEKHAGNLDKFYEQYVYGVADIDYNKYLGYAGFKLINNMADNNIPALGITTTIINGKTIITSVVRNSAAWIDGLNVNDELTTIDGRPFIDVTSAVAGKNIGDKLTIGLTRDGLPVSMVLTLRKNPQVKYYIANMDNLTNKQLVVRNQWLK